MATGRVNLTNGLRGYRTPSIDPRGTISFTRNADGFVTPTAVDRRGNLISGTDLINSVPIPNGSIGAYKRFIKYNGLLAYGQSLSQGSFAQPALTLTQPYNNLTLGSGVKSCDPTHIPVNGTTYSPGTTTSIPLVEDNNQMQVGPDDPSVSGETIISTACNEIVRLALLNDGILAADHIWFGSTPGRQSYALEQLDNLSPWWPYMLDHLIAQKARVADLGSSDYALRLVCWLGQQTNAFSPVGNPYYSFNRTRLVTNLAKAIDDAAVTYIGQTVPVHHLFMQTTYWDTRGNAGAVPRSQIDALQDTPLLNYVFPDFILPNTGLHLTNVGSIFGGYLFGRAGYQRTIRGVKPDAMIWTTATWVGTTLTINASVPDVPIVIRPQAYSLLNNTGATFQNGLRLIDSRGDVALSNVRVSGSGTAILADTARTQVGNAFVNIGLDFTAPNTMMLSATHDFCDSNTDTCTIQGVVYSMAHVANVTRIVIS